MPTFAVRIGPVPRYRCKEFRAEPNAWWDNQLGAWPPSRLGTNNAVPDPDAPGARRVATGKRGVAPEGGPALK